MDDKENMNEAPIMAQHLPEEIAIEIVSRLPPRSLLKYRCVSKPWSVLFNCNNPKLIDIIKNTFSIMLVSGNDIYSIDNESLSSSSPLLDGIDKIQCPAVLQDFGKERFVGYCNGLFCLCNDERGNFSLWNPSTGDCKGIPSPPQFQVDFSIQEYIYGFGYDWKSDDYKFVHIAINYSNFNRSEVRIYSLRLNSWKRIQHTRYLQSTCGYGSQWSGVFCNGALHWRKYSSSKALIALDMADENFREISQPESLNNEHRLTTTRIDVMDGCLSLLCYNFDLDSTDAGRIVLLGFEKLLDCL